MRILSTVAVIAACGFVTGIREASASIGSISAVGSPQDSNSWLQAFDVTADAPGTFDVMSFTHLSGDLFSSPYFSASGWSTTSPSSGSIVATRATAAASANFGLTFATDITTDTAWSISVVNSDLSFMGGAVASYDGGTQTWAFGLLNEISLAEATAVLGLITTPAPGGALLAAIGLAIIGRSGRRRQVPG